MFDWFKKISKRYMSCESHAYLCQSPDLAGVSVTPSSALGVTAVWAAVRCISESIASLPLILYRTTPEGRERATDHPLYNLVHDEPNPDMGISELLETCLYWLLTNGNGYLPLTRDGAGQVQEIYPIESNRVQPTRIDDRLTYYVDGKPFPPTDLIHVKLISPCGVVGLSPLTVARLTLGRIIATDRASASMWKNEVRPSGILKVAGELTPNAQANLKESFKGLYGGSDNHASTVILEEGLDYQPLRYGFSMQDQDWVAQMNFSVEDVARIYGIPPQKLQQYGRVTWNNSEAMNLFFWSDCLRPILCKIEQQLNRRLLSSVERQSYFFEFLPDDILRTDAKTRMQIASQGIINGIWSQNHVREKFYNLQAVPGGDELWKPLNYGTDDAKPEKDQEDNVTKEREDGNTVSTSGN